MTTTANISATINGVTFSGLTIEQAQALAGMALATVTETAKAAKPSKVTPKAKPAKAEAKAAKVRREHDAILDTKRVERMTKTAQAALAKAGFSDTKAMKQGKWMWIYPTNGKGRTPEFKAAKLAKGWKYSPKRGAFYRDFS